jgi:hypothetical protein
MDLKIKVKVIKDLTKDELISLLYNNFDVNIFEESAECVGCCVDKENYKNAKYHYICDSCQNELV